VRLEQGKQSQFKANFMLRIAQKGQEEERKYPMRGVETGTSCRKDADRRSATSNK